MNFYLKTISFKHNVCFLIKLKVINRPEYGGAAQGNPTNSNEIRSLQA